VSRTALTELGLSLFTTGRGINNNIGRVTTQQFAAPGFDELSSSKLGGDWQKFGAPVTSADGKLTFSDFLNFFLFSEKYDLGVMIKALQQKGLFESLAEPNLVAESGKEASFLAGGEFPIPIAQGSGSSVAVSVVFKEFGIRLSFTPTVNGDRVHLKVKPEVSTLDFANGVALQGFRIPALTTRRTETELELRNGQTFAIAGLMSNSVSNTMSKVPGIGDIPVLGYLFRSKAAQKNQTELVVMITPTILANNSTGVTPNLPKMQEPFLPPVPQNKLKEMPPPAFSTPGSGASIAPAAAPVAAQAPAAAPNAKGAAAKVTSLAPAAPKVIETNGPKPINAQLEKDKKDLERARHEAEAQSKNTKADAPKDTKADEKAKAEDIKRQTEQILADRHRAEQEKIRQDKLSQEQAKRDGENARKAQQAAQKQAEKDREQQKQVDEAAARLKAAEAQYQAELAKKNNP
jgi:hypothetical protein